MSLHLTIILGLVDNYLTKFSLLGASQRLDVPPPPGWSVRQAGALLCLKVDSHL